MANKRYAFGLVLALLAATVVGVAHTHHPADDATPSCGACLVSHTAGEVPAPVVSAALPTASETVTTAPASFVLERRRTPGGSRAPPTPA